MSYRCIIVSFMLLSLSLGFSSCSTSWKIRYAEKRGQPNLNKALEKDERQLKAEKKLAEQDLAAEEAHRKDVERIKSMQTAKTRERMEETRKKAEKVNGTEDECFLKKLFKRKKKRHES